MSIIQLHPHLLFTILESLDFQEDLSSAMLACSHLYKVGVKCMLTHPVTISSGWQLVSFCQFMLSDFSPRLPLFHTLRLRLLPCEAVLNALTSADTINPMADLMDSMSIDDEPAGSNPRTDLGGSVDTEDPQEKHGISMLVHVLERAVGLQDLDIDELEPLLFVEPALIQAIASLPSLTCLTTTCYGRRSHELCSKIRSQELRAIDINFWHESTGPTDDSNIPYDALVALLSTYPDLQDVTAKCVTFPMPIAPHSSRSGAAGSSSRNLPFLRWVHTLSLQGITGLPLIPELFSVFPNVRNLTFSCNIPSSTTHDRLQQLRALNQGTARWASLDELAGDLPSLYVLNLHDCRAARLDIDSPFFTGRDTIDRASLAHQYGSVLADTRPTSVRLRWTHDREIPFGDPWWSFKDICHATHALGPFARGVRHLVLDMDVCLAFRTLEIPSVASFPDLWTLVVRVRTLANTRIDVGPDACTDGHGHVLVLSNRPGMPRTTFGSVVRRVLQSHQTLRHVALALPSHSGMRHWWKSTEPKVLVQMIPEALGRDMLDEDGFGDVDAFQ
ncbi:uncharacterized protein BXZ73DRAFT_105998 [Epithele typhae]|uniref:uncharacterized protein n=1 Tax=Epithele typhae TaxID=378194 RepID=UPI00200761D9|nr:uncharacterized protein BXZ73DRAFT_105998 [Epithele typhae]KAH9915931.1 hypothetical protein BXZ73DRAFT_105998 [Epithele typhae]